jgi:hypothetical protein
MNSLATLVRQIDRFVSSKDGLLGFREVWVLSGWTLVLLELYRRFLARPESPKQDGMADALMSRGLSLAVGSPS